LGHPVYTYVCVSHAGQRFLAMFSYIVCNCFERSCLLGSFEGHIIMQIAPLSLSLM